MEPKKSFLAEWWYRLQQSTPVFFKKMMGIGATLIAMGTAIMVPDGILDTVNWPEWLMETGKTMIIVGTVMSVISKAAVKDASSDPNIKQ